MARNIPDRWIPYKPCGRVIKGTRIVCFKVPLKLSVQKSAGIEDVWDIKALIKAIPRLGAVIDLTNTTRYYDPKEMEKNNILHKKIFIPGREIPPSQKVEEFMSAVDEFLSKDKDLIVGVHCTHGLNRTGYLVCRYMRDRLSIPANDAIKRFEVARGYQIERKNYIEDLIGNKPPPPDLSKDTVVRPIIEREKSHSPIRRENSKKRHDSDSSGYEFDYKHDY